jgi:hypothetical protein
MAAYFNEPDGSVAVAINSGSKRRQSSSVHERPRSLHDDTLRDLSDGRLAAKAALGVTTSRFMADLAPQSVTTFVGKP